MEATNVRVLSLIVGSLLPLGCGGGGNPVDSGGDNDQTGTPTSVATTVTLSPSALFFTTFGETQQLTATVVDQNGATMSGASVSWSSSTPSVASVSTTGLVTAVANGAAAVTATSGFANGTASVTVDVPVFQFQSVSAGDVHGCGVTTAGAAYCWGGNS